MPARLLAAALLFVAPTARADDWPRFRGPNGSGTAAALRLPLPWAEADANWKVRLPGAGHSSPAVARGMVVVTCGDDKTGRRYVLAFRAADGTRLWERTFDGEPARRHEDNSAASSSPAVDDRHVYVCFASPKDHLVIALDHAGEEVWRADLGPFRAGHGHGASPVVCGDVVAVANDQDGPSTLVGLDRATGKIRWRVPRRGKSSYATPCVFAAPGRPAELIFSNYEHGVTSVDPATGKLNWELDVFDKRHVESAIASPVVAGDLVLASCGWLGVRQEVVAVRPPSSPGANPAKVWTIDRSVPLCTTPLVKDGLVFLWGDKGVVTCADARTGESLWRERVPGEFYSSPVAAGDVVLNVSRDGDVVGLKAARTFELVGRGPLGEGTHGSPALADGRLVVRTFGHLLSLGGKGAR